MMGFGWLVVEVCLASRCGVAVVFVLVVANNVQNTLPQLVCALLAVFHHPVHTVAVGFVRQLGVPGFPL